MSTQVEKIIDQLKDLTLIESAELVTLIEQTFGVDASASSGGVAMNAPDQGQSEEAAVEKTTFDVMVEAIIPEKRVAVLKVIRKLTTLGLAEAKEFTTSLPKALKEGVSKDEAEETKKALEEVGVTVTIS